MAVYRNQWKRKRKDSVPIINLRMFVNEQTKWTPEQLAAWDDAVDALDRLESVFVTGPQDVKIEDEYRLRRES